MKRSLFFFCNVCVALDDGNKDDFFFAVLLRTFFLLKCARPVRGGAVCNVERRRQFRVQSFVVNQAAVRFLPRCVLVLH